MRKSILMTSAFALFANTACAEITTTARVEDRLVASNQERFLETDSERVIALRYVGEDPFTGALRVEVAREDTCLVETYDRVEQQRIEERKIANPLVVGSVAGLAVGSAACAGIQAATSGCLAASVTDDETGVERPLTPSENTVLVVSLASIALASAGAVGVDLWRARDTTVLGSEDVNAARERRPCGVHPVAGEPVIFATSWGERPFIRRVMTDEDGVATLRLSDLPLDELPSGFALVEVDVSGEVHASEPLPAEWEEARVARLEQEAFTAAKEGGDVASLLSYLERFPEGKQVATAHALVLERAMASEEVDAMMRYLERHGDAIDAADRRALEARANVIAPVVYMRGYEAGWRGGKIPAITHPSLAPVILTAVVEYHRRALKELPAEDLEARDAHMISMARVFEAAREDDLPADGVTLLVTEALATEAAVYAKRTSLDASVSDAAMARASTQCERLRGSTPSACEKLDTRRHERAIATSKKLLSADDFDMEVLNQALAVAEATARGEKQREQVAALTAKRDDRIATAIADAITPALSRDDRLIAWQRALGQASTLDVRISIATRAVKDLSDEIERAVLAGDESFINAAMLALGVDEAPEVWKKTRAGEALGDAFSGALVARAKDIASAHRIEDIPEWQAALAMAEKLSPKKAKTFARVERELLQQLRKQHPLSGLRWREAVALYPPIETDDAALWYDKVDAAKRRNKSGRVLVKMERERAVGDAILVRVYHPESQESCLALVSPSSKKVRQKLERGHAVIALAKLDGSIAYRRDGRKVPIARLDVLAVR